MSRSPRALVVVRDATVRGAGALGWGPDLCLWDLGSRTGKKGGEFLVPLRMCFPWLLMQLFYF